MNSQTSPSLDRVRKGDLCAGCGACAGIAPAAVSMRIAAPGYLRPEQTAPLSKDQETLIAGCCPGLGQHVEAEGRTDSALWGPYLSMQTGWATDDRVRYSGSSGGVLSMMLIHLLESGRVDAVVQTTAATDLPIGNATVISRNADGVIRAAGSRYAPSAPLAGLSDLVAQGGRFAFVGKPCDAVALRALCRADSRIAAHFPVIMSFFCAGVPSHTGGKEVLAALGTTLDETQSFRFRGNGWPGRATAVDADGQERSMSYHDSWGRILSRHVQHRCKICADGTGVAADLVCADAWESDDKGYPLFTEKPGVSLIVARTTLGEEILAEAVAAGRVATEPFDIPSLTAIQPGQRERRRALLARLSALRLLRQPVPDYRGLHLFAAGRQNTLRRNAKNFLGTLRRALKRRRT